MRSAIQLDNANSFLMVTSFPPISSNRTRAPAPPFDLGNYARPCSSNDPPQKKKLDMLERGWLTSFWSHLSLSHCRLKPSWFLASEHAQVISFEFHSSFSAITFQNDTRCPGCNVLNLLSPIQRIEGGKLLNELSQMGTELGKEIQQVLYRCGTLLSSLDSVKQMVGRVCDIFF